MANFNAADVDCGCLLGDIKAKISGNGADSDNKIKARISGDLDVFQGDRKGAGNDAFLDTLVYGDADTGKNDANRNTGGVNGGDPEILTGDADSDIKVKNSANANIFGSFEDIHLPGGINFDFHFDRVSNIRITFEKSSRWFFYNRFVEMFVNKSPGRQYYYEATGISREFPAENIIVELIK